LATKKSAGKTGGPKRPTLASSHSRGGPPKKKGAAPRPRPRPVAPPGRLIEKAQRSARKPRPSTPPAPATSLASPAARELAIHVAVAALEKKAVGLEILDVAGRVDYADFVVLMTGRSDRQVAALAQGIEQALEAKGKRPFSVEGMQQARWVLMDYGDVVVHVFQDEARSLYDLEGLWMDATRLPVPGAAEPP
jgi:ribosome-associated protein